MFDGATYRLQHGDKAYDVYDFEREGECQGSVQPFPVFSVVLESTPIPLDLDFVCLGKLSIHQDPLSKSGGLRPGPEIPTAAFCGV